MLSFIDKESEEITQTIVAIVDGGRNDRELLYLYDKPINILKKKDNVDMIDYAINKKGKKIGVLELELMKKALIEEQKEYYNGKFKDQYKENVDKYNKIKNDIYIYDGKFIPMIDINKDRCVWSINGAAGSGKSFLASLIIKAYQTIFPDAKVYLFSQKEYDQPLDELGVIRVPINENINQDIIKELEDCLCIFDDIDMLPDVQVEREIITMRGEKEIKKVKTEKVSLSKQTQNLRDTILEVGRSKHISVIAMSHQMFNYGKTRNMLLESDFYIYFNLGSGPTHIKRFLKQQLGVEKDMEKKILDIKSRWTLVSLRTAPRYILGENQAFIV